MTEKDRLQIAEVGRGTLDVVLATPKCIVVATDSRRTSDNGSYTDDSKKLFIVGTRKVLAIAGLADVSLVAFPELTAQIAPLLEMKSLYPEIFDDHRWADPPPPKELSEEDKVHWRWGLPTFWMLLDGPIQTILSIALTLNANNHLNGNEYALTGIVAGFKPNGEAKIERLDKVPVVRNSNWGLPVVMIANSRQVNTTASQLIWETAGVTQLANMILHGTISSEVLRIVRSYDGITDFLRLRQAQKVGDISEIQMVALATDLIRATASITRTVGKEPIQIAILKPEEDVILHQQTFPNPGLFLPVNGRWNLGVEFTSDYPFNEIDQGGVYTHCVITDNYVPIPLGNNYFYGCQFQNTKFIYKGGEISFGQNNTVKDCTLIVEPGVDIGQVESIRQMFATVIL